jgi:S1-C subfamily serine protease
MEKQKNYPVFIISSLISAVIGGVIGAQAVLHQMPEANAEKPAVQQTENQKTVYVEESQIIDTVEKVSPSVVSIVISKDLPLYRQGVRQFNFDNFFNDPFGNPFEFNMPFQEPDRDTDGNIKKESHRYRQRSGRIPKYRYHRRHQRHRTQCYGRVFPKQ